MKGIVVMKPGSASWAELEKPVITRDDQVLVRIKASGICGSDVHVWHGTNPYATYPRVLGHEASGIVEEVGSGVSDLKCGDGVVFEPITYCGHCYACRNGRHNVCRNLKVLGCSVDGTFREYAVVPRSQVYRFDTSKMTYVQAAVCEPYTIGLQATSRGDVREGDLVLIHGAGPIGLVLCNVAKSMGAKVIVSEPNEKRLAWASKFGADWSVNPLQEDLHVFIDRISGKEGVNVVFEAAGIPALIQDAVHLLSPAGRFVPMTFGKELIPIDFKAINAKELTICGSRHQYQKFPIVVDYLPNHLREVDMLVTHTFPASEYAKAFSTLADKESGARKVVLTF